MEPRAQQKTKSSDALKVHMHIYNVSIHINRLIARKIDIACAAEHKVVGRAQGTCICIDRYIGLSRDISGSPEIDRYR